MLKWRLTSPYRSPLSWSTFLPLIAGSQTAGHFRDRKNRKSYAYAIHAPDVSKEEGEEDDDEGGSPPQFREYSYMFCVVIAL